MADRHDLNLHDTPALKILADHPGDFPDIQAEHLADAQLFLRVAKRMLGTFAADFSSYGLSPGRYAVLMSLYSAPKPLAPSIIAARVGVTPPTMTGLIATLQKAGLVNFVASDSRDGRRKSVALTEAGRVLIEDVAPHIFTRMCTVIAAVSETDLVAFRAALHAIESNIAKNRENAD